MNFRPELADEVLAGRKTVTRRIANGNPRSPWWTGGCSLETGRDYAVCPGRGKGALARVVVTDTVLEPLGYLTDAEAVREGFADASGFAAAFEAINGSYDPEVLVWRVEFGEVLS